MRAPFVSSVCLAAATCAVLVGVAIAQVEASASTYFLDVDAARYAGPASQRFALRVDDQPRHVSLSPRDEICVQLAHSDADVKVISARVRVLMPEPQDTVSVRVAGPDVSPGTFRSTPSGMLLRVVPSPASQTGQSDAVGTTDAPVCSI